VAPSGQQGVFTYYLFYTLAAVGERGGELDAHCDGGSDLLRGVATAVFMSLVLSDMLETYDIHLWLTMFPTCAEHEKLKLCEFEDPDATGPRAGTIVIRPVTGITVSTRIFFYLLVVAGKLFMAVAIAIAGAGLVLRASTDFDLILNAVAAGFVLVSVS
jgi:hypothetical protein